MAEDNEHGPLLTDRQRRHLEGKTNIEEGSATDRAEKSRIRKRLRNVFVDFRFLFNNLPEDDRDSLFDVDPYEQHQIHDGMVAAVALFYEIHERNGWDFEEFLSRAIEDVYSNPDRTPNRTPERMIVENVEFNVDLKSPPIRKEIQEIAIKKFKNGEPLTDREFRLLVEGGGMVMDPETDEYISVEDIIEITRERRRERRKEAREDEMAERIEENVDMFGEGYSMPPEMREENGDET